MQMTIPCSVDNCRAISSTLEVIRGRIDSLLVIARDGYAHGTPPPLLMLDDLKTCKHLLQNLLDELRPSCNPDAHAA